VPDGAGAGSRRELRQAVRRQLEGLEPGLKLVAEEVLADVSSVDWLGVDAHGRAVLVLIADEGDDLSTFTRAIAARAWARPRVRDWAQLAPPLRFQSGADVRAVLVCPGFDPDTTTAAVTLGERAVELALFKPLAGDLADPGEIELLTPQPPRPAQSVEPPPFRTGLSAADLGISDPERSELAGRDEFE
jgi:RecB family endonuclease NucS